MKGKSGRGRGRPKKEVLKKEEEERKKEDGVKEGGPNGVQEGDEESMELNPNTSSSSLKSPMQVNQDQSQVPNQNEERGGNLTSTSTSSSTTTNSKVQNCEPMEVDPHRTTITDAEDPSENPKSALLLKALPIRVRIRHLQLQLRLRQQQLLSSQKFQLQVAVKGRRK